MKAEIHVAGVRFYPGYLDRNDQAALLAALDQVFATAPLFTPRMPKSGRPFTVRMSNCGPLGWISDEAGYRYAPTHPATGRPWPPMPEALIAAWRDLADYPHGPEACLINFYGPAAKMGLHQDRDEEDFEAPVVSLSLGDSCLFRLGGHKRNEPSRSFRLNSGDALVLGGTARLAFHGVDRIYPGTSTLLAAGGRINLTMRRVTRANDGGSHLAGGIWRLCMINRRMESAAAGFGRFAVLACAILTIPARAEEPVFPTGAHIGLVPPAGMTLAQSYPGFIDTAQNAGILVGMLPLAAYPNIEKTLADDALKKQGFTPEKRETLQLNIGQGLLIVGTEVGSDKTKYRKWMLIAKTPDLTALVTVQEPVGSNAYSDSVVHASLATLAEREVVPDAELLKLLPFTVGDLADFKVANIIPGRALMLLDTPKDPHLVVTPGLPEFAFNARFIIAAVPNPPASNEERADLARYAFNSIAGIKDIHLTMSEPIRMDNRQGFETVAQAKDTNTNGDIVVVQWLRFEGDHFLQMVGISRADVWSMELPRMRAMRDSVAMK